MHKFQILLWSKLCQVENCTCVIMIKGLDVFYKSQNWPAEYVCEMLKVSSLA